MSSLTSEGIENLKDALHDTENHRSENEIFHVLFHFLISILTSKSHSAVLNLKSVLDKLKKNITLIVKVLLFANTLFHIFN